MRHCIRLHNSEKGLACTWWIWLVGGVSATCVAAIDIGRPQTAWLVLRSNSAKAKKHLRRRNSTKRQHEANGKGLQSSFSTLIQSSRQAQVCLKVHE